MRPRREGRSAKLDATEVHLITLCVERNTVYPQRAFNQDGYLTGGGRTEEDGPVALTEQRHLMDQVLRTRRPRRPNHVSL